MEKNIRNFGISLLFCLMFVFIQKSLIHGISYFGEGIGSRLGLMLVDSLIYGIFCFLIFRFSLHKKSFHIWFLILSLGAVCFLFLWSLRNAAVYNLSLRMAGHEIFVNGQITEFGVIYKLFNPLTALAILAGLIFLKRVFRLHSHNAKFTKKD